MLNDYTENLWLLYYFFSLAITIVVCKVLSMHIHIHTISQVASLSKHTWEKNLCSVQNYFSPISYRKVITELIVFSQNISIS